MHIASGVQDNQDDVQVPGCSPVLVRFVNLVVWRGSHYVIEWIDLLGDTGFAV